MNWLSNKVVSRGGLLLGCAMFLGLGFVLGAAISATTT